MPVIQLTSMSNMPTKTWDDLVAVGEGQTKSTVYTLDYVKKSKDPAAQPGIVLGKDGIYDIIIDAPQLTRKNVTAALKELTKQTGIEYRL